MNERYLKYESKIDTRYLKDTILSTSYLCDRKNSAYKPILTNDELDCLLSNQSQIQANKQKIFDNLVWYAAYIAQHSYWNRYKVLYKNVEYDEYLQFALECMWFALDRYDAKLYNCSVYTYLLNDYRFRIRKHIEDMYNSLGLHHNMQTDKYKSILKSLAIENRDINYIFDMSDESFNDIYGCKRKSFLCYVAGINVISIDDYMDSGNTITVSDTLADKYSEEIYKLIDAKFVIEDIRNAVLKRWKKSKNIYRDYKIFEEYTTTNMTYADLGRKYGITREGIRVVIRKFKWRLKNTKTAKRILDEEDE